MGTLVFTWERFTLLIVFAAALCIFSRMAGSSRHRKIDDLDKDPNAKDHRADEENKKANQL
jgi:hypothetical protein